MISEQALLAFRDELRKTAAGVPWKALGGNVGSLMGAGAGIGGLVGAAHGGYKAYRDAKEQGGSSPITSGIVGGISGTATGALAGAGLGALAGGVGTFTAPELTGRLAQRAVQGERLGAFGRFGQRQVHGVTGWTPEGGLESIRGGAWYAKDKERRALQAVEEARGVGGKSLGKAERAAEQAAAGSHAATEAQEKGLTSLPGIAKALRKDPMGAVKSGLKEQWHNTSPLEKAVGYGLPALGMMGAAASPDDPNDPHKGRRVGALAANMVGGMATASLPFAGGVLAQSALTPVGYGIGALADRAKKKRLMMHPGYNAHMREQTSEGSHLPAERVMSPAAAGQAPDLGSMG